MEIIIEPIFNFIISTISNFGYLGIIFAMAVESANIPLPSEIIMPFSGYLVFKGEFNLLAVSLSGALGNLLGSLLSYAIGYFGGESVVRQLIKKYGRFIFINEKEYYQAKEWFFRKGDIIVLVSRILPVVRTFVSLPAGVARMNPIKFTSYTFFGSFLWSLFLAYIGLVLGERWQEVMPFFRQFDFLIAIAFLTAVSFYIYKKVKSTKVDTGKVV
ncbi:MAG: hypothetical protein A2Y57_01075 [Candidatus Woykebacteria bacterium RBG_13_40_7b]|uniref:VTT domain-containing protein n=1 Tax=Candidatus Woykebacteria bacterium RBG_13_40_7b TaxID=1802594 RepID=A0A1G1W862_9BACT|nr:MAG: hypothetical protein A2Y57_01075 [Candidatus Woykebacteria bacterium RBG_13_40_7b]